MGWTYYQFHQFWWPLSRNSEPWALYCRHLQIAIWNRRILETIGADQLLPLCGGCLHHFGSRSEVPHPTFDEPVFLHDLQRELRNLALPSRPSIFSTVCEFLIALKRFCISKPCPWCQSLLVEYYCARAGKLHHKPFNTAFQILIKMVPDLLCRGKHLIDQSSGEWRKEDGITLKACHQHRAFYDTIMQNILQMSFI